MVRSNDITDFDDISPEVADLHSKIFSIFEKFEIGSRIRIIEEGSNLKFSN